MEQLFYLLTSYVLIVQEYLINVKAFSSLHTINIVTTYTHAHSKGVQVTFGTAIPKRVDTCKTYVDAVRHMSRGFSGICTTAQRHRV